MLYLWDILNEIMLGFDIKMRKKNPYSPFNVALLLSLIFSFIISYIHWSQSCIFPFLRKGKNHRLIIILVQDTFMELFLYLDFRNFLQIPHWACAQSLLFILSLEKHARNYIIIAYFLIGAGFSFDFKCSSREPKGIISL